MNHHRTGAVAHNDVKYYPSAYVNSFVTRSLLFCQTLAVDYADEFAVPVHGVTGDRGSRLVSATVERAGSETVARMVLKTLGQPRFRGEAKLEYGSRGGIYFTTQVPLNEVNVFSPEFMEYIASIQRKLASSDDAILKDGVRKPVKYEKRAGDIKQAIEMWYV